MKNNYQFTIKLLNDNARIPSRSSQFSVGYDLYASEQAVVLASGRALVKTDISTTIPLGHYGRIAPRSGLAFKHGIETGAGVIDPDYTGEIKVLLFNHGSHDFHVHVGDRIAQLILEKCSTFDITDSDCSDKTRGSDGFGSSGY